MSIRKMKNMRYKIKSLCNKNIIRQYNYIYFLKSKSLMLLLSVLNVE